MMAPTLQVETEAAVEAKAWNEFGPDLNNIFEGSEPGNASPATSPTAEATADK